MLKNSMVRGELIEIRSVIFYYSDKPFSKPRVAQDAQ